MKPSIHPDYSKLTVRLSDGTTMETFSTMKNAEYAPEIDSTNHPFYTGKRQFVDTAGRVEKFLRRYRPGAPKPGEEAAEAEAPTETAA